MSKLQPCLLGLSAVLLLGLAACGGDTSANQDPDADVAADAGADTGDIGADGDSDTTALTAAPREPVQPTQGEVCVLDIDCAPDRFCFLNICSIECDAESACPGDETCSPRGRCLAQSQFKSLDGEGDGAAPEYVEDLRFEELPARTQRVTSGLEELTVSATVSGPVPAEGIAYRIETEEAGSEVEVRRAAVDGDQLRFTLPTGRANPLDEEPTRVETNVVSAVGSFSITLIPEPPVPGIYAGEARVDRLGNMAIPIQFMVVTDPPNASLEEADSAWLLLPIGDEELLSPHDAFDAVEWQARPLEYDDFVDAWVARFDNEFRFSDGSLLGERPAGQVGRTLRFEVVTRDGGVIGGSFTDRWTGLYDERSESGVLESGVVTFTADFEVQRFYAGLTPDEITEALLDGPPAELLPLPPIDACDDAMLVVEPISIDEMEVSCQDITTLAAFVNADSEARADCAIAVAETALAGDTVAGLLSEFLDGDEITPGGESFEDFMERCASGADGACRPSDEILCGRQLVAYAYVAEEDDLADSAQLVDSFEATTREAFLGRQLGAFQTDSNLRLEWLSTSDYPAIVTSAVEDLNAALLDEWVTSVLDVHAEVLAGQFDASGLAVLAREPTSQAAIERRRTLLFDMTQGWRATMESLLLATQRWNTLLQDDESRAEATAFVSRRMVDLYVLAGLAGNLNQSAGAGFANSAFAGGFGALRRELRDLELPFNQLVYARDAEVVVSTSLDPESDNNTVLTDARENALAEIEDAQTGVGDLLAEAQARALSESQLRNQLDNDLDEARGDLVELCGLPNGCGINDFPGESECVVRIAAGECGFAIDRLSGELRDYAGQPVTTSDAGHAILAVLDAINNYNIVLSEVNAHYARANTALDDAEAFSLLVERWNDRRQSTLDEIDQIISDRQHEWGDTVQELLATVKEQEALRKEAIAAARVAAREWQYVRVSGRSLALSYFKKINNHQHDARIAGLRQEVSNSLAAMVAEGFPTARGMSNDETTGSRVGALALSFIISKTLRFAQTVRENQAEEKEALAAEARDLNEAMLLHIERQSGFGDRQYQNYIDALSSRFDAWEIIEGRRDANTDRLISLLERTVEYELAYERDQQELLDRRSAAWGLLRDNAAMQLRTVQAEHQIEQRLFEYIAVVQRAELIQSRINELESQQQNVNLLLASPAVVYSWANRLQQAELRLERAKSALMDWLVAMEYFAVRPFMDQRIQILLARNPYQLEAVAAEMQRLERACGGPLSEQSVEVRLASLLGVADAVVDLETSDVFSAGERLRAVLERGAVPVDTRVRYSPSESVGDLLNREEVWAATMTLDLDRFADLATACNAKIVSFDVQLSGQDLGSDVLPTVTILYDGMSQLRSCQPGIADYVAQFGPQSTAFNQVTTFRTPTRAVSPVAGLNTFPTDTGGTGNLSLAGLPLASQYSILIDRQQGENGRINWNNLEDVVLRVNYAYQDVFPVGQCE